VVVELYDVVELVEALPEEGLSAGSVGTIVHVFKEPNLAYEVEFADDEGRTLAMLPLAPQQLRPRSRP
jgi:Domain of unknown function (DUF4926)